MTLTSWNGGVRILGDREQFLGGLPQLFDEREMNPKAFTLSGHVTTFLEGLLQQGKVRSLEQGRCWTNGIRRIRDDDIVFVLVLWEELESIADEDSDFGVSENGGHVWEVLLGDSDDSFVDVTESDVLDGGVLENFTDNTTVSTTDDEDVAGVGV